MEVIQIQELDGSIVLSIKSLHSEQQEFIMLSSKMISMLDTTGKGFVDKALISSSVTELLNRISPNHALPTVTCDISNKGLAGISQSGLHKLVTDCIFYNNLNKSM